MIKKIAIGIFLFLVILMVILVGITAYLYPERHPIADGPRVTIDSGGHHIEGILAESTDFQVLLKDEGVSLGTFSGDAFVTMLPFDTAEQLKAKYGDFFTCNEPGALQAIRKMQATILVAGDDKTKGELVKAMDLVRESQIPVVRFTAAVLKVEKHTYLGMQVHDGAGIPIYYLTDLQIIQEDYMK